MKSGDIVTMKQVKELQGKTKPFIIDSGLELYDGSLAITISFSGYKFVKGLPHSTKLTVLKTPQQ